MQTLTGKWQGTFSQQLGKKDETYEGFFEFTMELVENEDGFEGYCWDVEIEEGKKERSRIKGFRDGNMISFIKIYENCIDYDEETDMFLLYKEGESLDIHYYGEFDQKTERFFGIWEIKLDEHEDVEGLITEIETGYWDMKKIN